MPTRPIVLRRPEIRWPDLVLPIACNEKARGPPLLVSGLERNKEIAVTRSRTPVRHLQTAVWPGAKTGYDTEQKSNILWAGGNDE